MADGVGGCLASQVMQVLECIARRRVHATRCLFVIALAVATACFLLQFGWLRDQGHDSSLPVIWFVACLPLFAVVHLPAWFLLPRLALEPDVTQRVRLFVFAEFPLATVTVAGLVILAGDWDKLHLFWIPTLPSMFAIAWVAASRDARAAA